MSCLEPISGFEKKILVDGFGSKDIVVRIHVEKSVAVLWFEKAKCFIFGLFHLDSKTQ